MARCWTCGSSLAGGSFGHTFVCPLCSGEKELKRLREGSTDVRSLDAATALFCEATERLSEIAGIIEWGFEEVEWRLDVIANTLADIDATLRSPSVTKASEWRMMAEELRRRGALEQSEEFYLKSLKTNPLDYLTYVGLGKTYLQMGKVDKARTYWEKSLPHAPTIGIDYRSYSYRLIGRSYFCENDVQKAVSLLKTAIELSPRYYLGHYDYAQYCALVGDAEDCLNSLMIAVLHGQVPVELAKNDGSLKSLPQVGSVLEVLGRAEKKLPTIETEASRKAEGRWPPPCEAGPYASPWRRWNAKFELECKGRRIASDWPKLQSEYAKMMEYLQQTDKSISEMIQDCCNRRSLAPEDVKRRWPFEYLDGVIRLAWQRQHDASECLGSAAAWAGPPKGYEGYQEAYYRKLFYDPSYKMSCACEAVLMYCTICNDVMRVAQQP